VNLDELRKQHWMPAWPDSERLVQVREKFTERRGIRGIAMTVDGTHVPWVPDDSSTQEDYHN
jgi:hypothetical protein